MASLPRQDTRSLTPPPGQWPGPPNQVQLTAHAPQGFTPQQTRGSRNYQMAQAHATSDPRLQMKGYDRAGLSRSKGQQAYAASAGANAYAQQAAAAANVPLQDAASNANLRLQYDMSRNQQALALARIQEQVRNQQRMFALQNQANAMGFVGNLFGDIGGGQILQGLTG